MIATAKYHHPTTTQTAEIVVWGAGRRFVTAAYIRGEGDGGPVWKEYTKTETAARQCGNLWHYRLTHNYHMRRVA
jgi:hypothetical protein